MEALIPILGFICIFAIFLIVSGLRVVDQYERGVILTLGKYTGTRQPGLTWILTFLGIQRMFKIDIRTKVVDVPNQEAITRDNVSEIGRAHV